MRKCSLANLDALLRTMAEAASVYLPVDGSDGRAHFTKWADGVKMSDALNTVRSAKDFFFPQTENLMDFKVEGKSIEIIDTREECEDFVIFGVRACDVRSFEILDRVFLVDPVDTYYKNRREHGIIVSMACNKPSETCFCRTFGIDAAMPPVISPATRRRTRCIWMLSPKRVRLCFPSWNLSRRNVIPPRLTRRRI